MDSTVFLDEFRPFRRGEIALAKKVVAEPHFLPRQRIDTLRWSLRLAQLSSLDGEPDELVDRIGSLRLRMLQLLAPALPTDPERIDAGRLEARLPRVFSLVAEARRRILEAGLASDERLDDIVCNKRLALVLGGAAGSGYVFLGALQQLEDLGLTPSYISGCSVGAVLAVIRARERHFDLDELFEDVRRLRENGAFRRPDPAPRYGAPAVIGLDLRRALGDLFAGANGRQRALGELAIPADVLSTGVGPGALGGSRAAFAEQVDVGSMAAGLKDVRELTELRVSALARAVAGLVSLAMSRRVLVPLFLGSDPLTAELPALDAAGFSAAIPTLLHYDPPDDDAHTSQVLDSLFERHALVSMVDGALASLVPAHLTWDAIEAGRIGSRNCLVLALDALAKPGGVNAPLAPILRTIAATADRDRAYWDLHVNFRRAPPFLDLFPTADRLRRATEAGEREFGPTADLLRALFEPLPRWKQLEGVD